MHGVDQHEALQGAISPVGYVSDMGCRTLFCFFWWVLSIFEKNFFVGLRKIFEIFKVHLPGVQYLNVKQKQRRDLIPTFYTQINSQQLGLYTYHAIVITKVVFVLEMLAWNSQNSQIFQNGVIFSMRWHNKVGNTNHFWYFYHQWRPLTIDMNENN